MVTPAMRLLDEKASGALSYKSRGVLNQRMNGRGPRILRSGQKILRGVEGNRNLLASDISVNKNLLADFAICFMSLLNTEHAVYAERTATD